MTIGLTIPGVPVVHPREAWLPYSGRTMTGPVQVPGNITQAVAHYTAADDLIDGDPGEHIEDMPAWLGATHRDYVDRRGYSIGYLFAVDYLGAAWELRGFDFKSAANYMHNDYTAPILFLVDGADPLNEYMLSTARALGREFRRRSGRADFRPTYWGHNQLRVETGYGTPTGCPGFGIQNQIDHGLLALDYAVPQEAEMKAIDHVRAYDSRPGTPVDPGLGSFNKDVPRTPLQGGQSRSIAVGGSEVLVNLTVVGHGPGHLSAAAGTSIVNYDLTDRVESCLTLLRSPGGVITIKANGAAVDFAVDIQGRTP